MLINPVASSSSPLGKGVAIRLNSSDEVAVALKDLPAGTELDVEARLVVVREYVPAGHKVALVDIARGAPVHKYGQVIGSTTAPVIAGEHIHLHNLSGDPAFPVLADSVFTAAEALESRTASRRTDLQCFDGIIRPDGRVATRNYIAVIPMVNCASSVARMIAEKARLEGLVAASSGLDGIIALTHASGCGMPGGDGVSQEGSRASMGLEILRRTLAGYASHPNIGGVVIVSLGCEVNQFDGHYEMPWGSETDAFHGTVNQAPFRKLGIQELGGTANAVRAGVEAVDSIVSELGRVVREPVGASELVVGLKCGASDGHSGLSANPALGAAVDVIVAQGGTAVLGETPEIYGAHHLLAARAVSEEVREALLQRISFWERYAAANGATLDENPSPGNHAGGITTIFEKSLGALAKAGTANLKQVVGYAEPVSRKGLVFMDTPGYDPVSVTGMIAGGVNTICFTTGRGSVFGSKPVPSMKLVATTQAYRLMDGDMDIDCGQIIDGRCDIEEMGHQIFDALLLMASGHLTKSERLGMGDEEIVPWHVGAVL